MIRRPGVLGRLKRDSAGAQLVEFALLLPIFCLLVFGIIDFGRGYFSWLIITNGAREGARTASLGKPLVDVTAKVQDSVTGLYMTSLVTGSCPATEGVLCMTTTNIQGVAGSPVTVALEYKFSYIVLPNFANVTGGVFPLKAQTTMRLE